MKHVIYDELSLCCGAPVRLDMSEPDPHVKELLYFICTKCKYQCHLKKKKKKESDES
jgi:hypothetical protein